MKEEEGDLPHFEMNSDEIEDLILRAVRYRPHSAEQLVLVINHVENLILQAALWELLKEKRIDLYYGEKEEDIIYITPDSGAENK